MSQGAMYPASKSLCDAAIVFPAVNQADLRFYFILDDFVVYFVHNNEAELSLGISGVMGESK